MTHVKYFTQAIVLLSVISVSAACTSLTASSFSQTLRYPAFSTNYANNQNECWVISTSTSGSDHVLLSFSTFNLEYATTCSFDYVRVLDGSSSSSDQIGRFCGSTVPQSVVSSGSSLYVQFRSDSSATSSGFRATYRIISRNDPEYGTFRSNYIYPVSSTCTSLTAFSTSQNFRYPLSVFSGSYGNSESHCWVISTVTGASHVMLSFSTFDLEPNANCGYDYVKVLDGSTSFSREIDTFCGSATPQSIVSSATSLYVEFRSDGSVTRSGFQASYQIISESDPNYNVIRTNYNYQVSTCASHTAYSFTQTFRYPTFSPYGNNENECWVITTSTSISTDHVLLSFSTFDLESSTSCVLDDYVRVHDGSTSSSTVVGTFCGSTVPQNLVSSGASFYVQFRSDSSTTGSGFQAYYQIISENDANYDTFRSFYDYFTPTTVSGDLIVIIGSGVGGAFLLIIIISIICACCCCKKKSPRAAPARPTVMMVPQPQPTYITTAPPTLVPNYGAVPLHLEPPPAPVYAAP